jgi:hypothetical protein
LVMLQEFCKMSKAMIFPNRYRPGDRKGKGSWHESRIAQKKRRGKTFSAS